MGCRQEADRRELVRLVRDQETGDVRLDLEGRAPGRGAYLHRDPACLEAARRRGGLARALRMAVPAQAWPALAAALSAGGSQAAG